MNFVKRIQDILPGLVVATALGMISIFLANYIPNLGGGTIAIFLGMFVGNLFLNQKVFQKGYKFAESDLLSYSIVLLGATLSVSTLMELGIGGIAFIVLQMSVTIAWAIYVGKKLKFSQNFGLMMAGGNAVCGSSAIGAIAPVIDADDNEKGIAITIVNVTGIFLMFLLPVIGGVLYNHSEMPTSALIGGTLQSVGQVVASGDMVNETVKELSTIFKIVRVILLVVVVIGFGHIKSKTSEEIVEEEVKDVKNGTVKVPWYVIGFFITCALFSFGIISEPVSILCKAISNKFEIIALAAIGLKVNVKELIRQGKAVSIYGVAVGAMQIVSAILLIHFLVK